MKEYKKLPAMYQIPAGQVKVIKDFAYTTCYDRYDCKTQKHVNMVFRVTVWKYQELVKKAKLWKSYQSNPSEVNLQEQISKYMESTAQMYCTSLI